MSVSRVDNAADPVERIVAFLSEHVPLEEVHRQAIREATRIERYPRGTVLLAEGQRAQTVGYQLFLQARLGWRWPARARGPWLEPSLAFNWWPIEVGRPASFERQDERWPSYFLFEPWLNFGWSW